MKRKSAILTLGMVGILVLGVAIFGPIPVAAPYEHDWSGRDPHDWTALEGGRDPHDWTALEGGRDPHDWTALEGGHERYDWSWMLP
jgi:hypothetical protein